MKKLDPRQYRSIRKLHKAYLSLLAKGEKQLTIQQICDEALITRPTFYKQFQNIQELRTDLHREILNQLKESLTLENPKPLAEITKEEIPKNMIPLFNHIYDNHVAYETLLVYHPDALFINEMKEIIRKFVKDGIHASKAQDKLFQMDLSFIISYATGAYLESILWWIKNDYPYTAEEMASNLLQLSLYGPYQSTPRIGTMGSE